MDLHDLDDEPATRPDLPVFAAALRPRAWAEQEIPSRPASATPRARLDDDDEVPTARIATTAYFAPSTR